MYSATDGGRVRAWTRVSPDRVTVDTDFRNTVIESYKVDGMAVPLQGVGSLIRFDGPDEGLLHRAGKTIAAAVYLENAAVNYAKEPVIHSLIASLLDCYSDCFIDSWQWGHNCSICSARLSCCVPSPPPSGG